VAKVDSAAVQDGFDLYLHGFLVTAVSLLAERCDALLACRPPRRDYSPAARPLVCEHDWW